jgi:flagellar export protein FliJ
MKPFRFKLDPVLRERERAQESAQQRLADLERQRVELESRLRDFAQAIDQERADLRAALGVGVGTLASARLQANASLGLARKAHGVVLALSGVCRRRDAAKEALAEAMRRRKAIALLRDSALEQWRLQQRRAEDAEQDEMVVMRHGRQERV